MTKRCWIDTHIHVSDIGPTGARRERLLEDLLDVLDRCDADLRFLVSCDGSYSSGIGRSPEGLLAGNRFIHDLVRRAPGRLYGSCTVSPNYGTMFDVREGQNPFPPCVGSLVRFLRQAGATDETLRRVGSTNAKALYRIG